MSAPIAKQLAMLQSPSHTFGTLPVQQRRGISLFQRALDVINWVAEYPRRMAVIDELQRLSDRELADIGLNRSEVRRVFARKSA